MFDIEKDFAVFILSHGRAKEIKTVNMLKRYNYTHAWYVVIDNEDDQADEYYRLFGEHVLMFDKKAEAELTDCGDLDNDRRVGVFARNKIQKLAAEMGYKYHLQLDDDFNRLDFRYPDGKRLACKACDNLDALFYYMGQFLDKTKVKWLSFGLSSDYLGGLKNDKYPRGVIPKTMGSFFMRADNPAQFSMRMNDDITTCIMNNIRGELVYTILYVQVQTPPTQHMKGGMTNIYQDNGTYRKSFYSVMCAPSCVKIKPMGVTNFRLHHWVDWNACTPKLLSDRWKK